MVFIGYGLRRVLRNGVSKCVLNPDVGGGVCMACGVSGERSAFFFFVFVESRVTRYTAHGRAVSVPQFVARTSSGVLVDCGCRSRCSP